VKNKIFIYFRLAEYVNLIVKFFYKLAKNLSL